MVPQTEASDWQLLQRFAANGDESAFALFVRRRISFVYAAARRQTRDESLADDVTQAVFIVLARKAHSIRSEAALTGWLFSVTRHAAQNAMKMRSRQRFYESRAAAQRAEMIDDPAPTGADIRSLLDAAIARLPKLEQTGVLLHYFRELPHEQVGAALGLSAEAARKRVSRAVDKLRQMFVDRGVIVGAAALVAALRAEAASAAPLHLTQSTINVAMLSASSASAGGASMVIAKGVSHMFTIAKIKAAAVIALCATGLATAAVPLAGIAFRSATPVITLTTSSIIASEDKFSVKVSDTLSLEFLGVSPFPGDESSWFNLAGDPIEKPGLPGEGRVMSQPPPEHQILIRADQTSDAAVHIFLHDAVSVANMRMRSREGETESNFYTTAFTLDAAAQSTALHIGIADQPWKTLGAHERPEEPGEVDGKEFGVFRISAMEDESGNAAVSVDSEDVSHEPHRVVAVDEGGKEYECTRINVQSDGQSVTTRYQYDVAPAKVKKFMVQGRKFNKFVDVTDISLAAGNKTEPKIVVKDPRE